MGCIPVQIPSISRCGVYHENSGTMFAVTFHQDYELAAAIFAEIYDHLDAFERTRMIEESRQQEIGDAIVAFIKAYGMEDDNYEVPTAWAQALDDYDQDDLNDGYVPHYRVGDLIADFAGGFSSASQRRRAEERIRFVIDQFNAWKVLP
jgi:hypothetical protein